MIRIVLGAILLAVSLAWGVSAQVGPIPGMGPLPAHFKVNSYTGPGDLGIPNVVFYWAVGRCYNIAYAGSVVDLSDSATGAALGSRLQCSGGVVTALVSGSACTWVTGNACSSVATTCAVACNVRALYDQSGQSNCVSTLPCTMIPATNPARPTYTLNAVGAAACITLGASGSFGLTGAGSQALASISQPVSIAAYGQRNSGSTANINILAQTNDTGIYFTNGVANEAQLFSGSNSAAVAVTDGTTHSFIGVFNGNGSSSLQVDGTRTSSLSPGTAGFSINAAYGYGNVHVGPGIFCEGGVYSNAMSTGNQTALANNMAAFY